jgi:hypothetical protein
MENPTTTEPTGGLPLVKGEMLGKSGLNVLGNKGVALGMDDSASIRDYLQQMIEQRQAYKGSFQQGMDQMRSVLGSTQNEMAQNMQAQSNKERTNEQDIFNMRVNMAQLKTQEDRLMQEKMQAAQNQLNFTNALRAEQGLPPLPSAPQAGMAPAPQAGMAPAPQAGMAPAPQGGMAPAPQGGMAPAPQGGMAPAPARPSNITATQMAMLQQMYADPSTRAEAQKQFFALTKQDDIMRRLKAAGIQEGSPQWNQALALSVAGTGAFSPMDTRTAGGTVQTTPATEAGRFLGGPQAAPVAPAPVAAPTAAVAPAAPPMAPTAATAPAAPAIAPQAAPAPARRSPFTPGSKEDLAYQQEAARVDIAGQTREAEKNAEAAAKELETHSAEVKEAKTNSMVAQNMQKDIRTAGSLLGKLAGGGAQSAFFGLIDQGIQVGQLGSINAPGFVEAVVKMDPKAKDPKIMDAYIRVAKDVEGLKLAYTRKVFEGQGAVTENERKLIDTAVGNVNRMSPANLMRMAKATELESRNKMDQDRLWNDMKNAGMTWRQYKSSKELADMQRNQFYRTAKTFGITDAVYPGDPAR